MPIKIPSDLPAFDVLTREGVMVMSESQAARQDIRPLRIGLLNLMPKKIQTENQFARLIGALSRVDAELFRLLLAGKIKESLDHLDFRFLAGLGVGVVACVMQPLEPLGDFLAFVQQLVDIRR